MSLKKAYLLLFLLAHVFTHSLWADDVIPQTNEIGVTQKYTLTYIVDDETYKSYEFEEGSFIEPETAPTKEGYIFSGWSGIPTTMPSHDVVVKGTFCQPINGRGWIDLGLPSGTLWATCNIGADSPEQYGTYFDWSIGRHQQRPTSMS